MSRSSATSMRMGIWSMGNNQSPRIFFTCAFCGELGSDKPSHFILKIRHFCSQGCYSKFLAAFQPIEEHPRWQGGVSNAEAHRRWKQKNPKRVAHLKARRYARERGASGSHTLSEWESLKNQHGNKCAHCGAKEPLTKDHIVPLSLGGTDDIKNIQPLCRSCNSRKWAKFPIYENPELLTTSP